MKTRIYMDYNATTLVRPEVKESIRNFLEYDGNASSVHVEGKQIRKIIESARDSVAKLLSFDESRVIFNSGATEGNNTVLKYFEGKHIAVSAIEHPATLESLEFLKDTQKTIIPVKENGQVDLDYVSELVKGDSPPNLISVMLVNNETGVIQPVKEISDMAREHNIALHIDAAQALGKMAFKFNDYMPDFMTLSGHKIGALQGIGALVCGKCTEIPCLIRGGGQEKRYRSGTENVIGILSFGAASEIVLKEIGSGEEIQRIRGLRDLLESELKKLFPEIVIMGENSPRAAGTSMFALAGTDSKSLVINMDLEGFAISNGSACSSGKVSQSHVLREMKTPPENASAALRVSLGWNSKESDVESFVRAYKKIIDRVKAVKS